MNCDELQCTAVPWINDIERVVPVDLNGTDERYLCLNPSDCGRWLLLSTLHNKATLEVDGAESQAQTLDVVATSTNTG